jgi:putative pyruvate formate lyase activating enzyme
VERAAGKTGFCGAPALPVVARAARHDWEEPCISGSRGSGAVFFSGCNLGCVYCQNREISRSIRGKPLDAPALRELFARLRDSGVHNINLVTATPYADVIAEALEVPPGIPVVWNCGGYERVETLRMLEGKIDVYLPDMKYADDHLAKELSGAGDYFEIADAAIREMVRQTGPCRIDDVGLLQRGVLVRHLVLPGFLANSKDVLEWFADAFPKGEAMLSLMAQYTPNGFGGPERRLREEEWREVADYLYMLGIRSGYVQELSSAEGEYVPSFDGTGVE